MLSDRLATDLRPGRDRLQLLVSSGTRLREIKISRVTCNRLTTLLNDIRGSRLNHDQPAKTCDQRRIQLRVGSLASEIDKFHGRFFTVKSDRGACRFHWRVGPSYCENPGVTYDLLVGNIGGTYDLADQLPSNCEFGHFSVVSQSQVPQEFGVNLALLMMSQHWFRLWLGAVRLQTIAWANVAPDLCHHTV